MWTPAADLNCGKEGDDSHFLTPWEAKAILFIYSRSDEVGMLNVSTRAYVLYCVLTNARRFKIPQRILPYTKVEQYKIEIM